MGFEENEGTNLLFLTPVYSHIYRGVCIDYTCRERERVGGWNRCATKTYIQKVSATRLVIVVLPLSGAC